MSRKPTAEKQAATDLEHLRILSICYYVFSGLMALCALFPIIHLAVGIAIVAGGFPQPQQQQPGRAQNGPPPELFGWVFIVLSSLAMLLGWTLSISSIIVARSLRRQKRYIFCLVVAGVACLQQPFGTVLGVFTLIVLARPSVKDLFARNALPPVEAEPGEPELDAYHHDEHID